MRVNRPVSPRARDVDIWLSDNALNLYFNVPASNFG
jgi:hypothetical protein